MMDQIDLFTAVPAPAPEVVTPTTPIEITTPAAPLAYCDDRVERAVRHDALPRVPGECVERLNYGSGRLAVEVGEIEIATSEGGTRFVFQRGALCFTLHPSQAEKFARHFRASEAGQ